MAATFTIDLATPVIPNPVDVSQQQIEVMGRVTFSGSYAAGGDTLSFGGVDQIRSNQPPNYVMLWEESAAPTGYFFYFTKGTTNANGKILVYQCAGSGNPAAEISAGAYPAALTNAQLRLVCVAKFPQGV